MVSQDLLAIKEKKQHEQARKIAIHNQDNSQHVVNAIDYRSLFVSD
jgi:hypothetical protein